MPANIPANMAGTKNVAATMMQLIAESSGKTSNSLSDLSTDALALTSDQLCENFSNISTPSVAKERLPMAARAEYSCVRTVLPKRHADSHALVFSRGRPDPAPSCTAHAHAKART